MQTAIQEIIYFLELNAGNNVWQCHYMYKEIKSVNVWGKCIFNTILVYGNNNKYQLKLSIIGRQP